MTFRKGGKNSHYRDVAAETHYGMTQEEVGRLLNISRQYVCNVQKSAIRKIWRKQLGREIKEK